MNFPLYIGFRYLKAKKNRNVINIISMISIIAICVTTAALVVVLSVFNGFEELVASMYNTFDPDLQITAAKGKTFHKSDLDLTAIRQIDEVISVSEVVEDNALIKNGEEQIIATIKGVSNDFAEDGHLDDMILFGNPKSLKNGMAVVGFGVGYNIGLFMSDLPKPVTVMIPKRTSSNLLNPANAFNSHIVTVNGVYSIQQELDDKYIIIPVDMARELLEYTDEVNSIEIRLTPGIKYKGIQKKIQSIVGKDYVVKNHFELQETLYNVMRSEKMAVYLILSFILLIAAFNLIGTLSMLIIDKEKDNTIIWSMGATQQTVKKIYYIESLLMTTIGAISGVVLGVIVCLIQIRFKLIKFAPGSSFIVDAYPIKILGGDLLLIFSTVIIIGALTALIPISRLKITINYNRK